MRSRIGAGIVAGSIAGVVFGVLMQMMTAPTPDGGRMPMMGMVAKVVRSDSIAVGRIYHLFNSAVIGAITYGTGLGWGALYGVIWWVLGGLILMPMFVGMPAFAPLKMMMPVAMGSLVGHLIYGVILGLALVWLRREQSAVSRVRTA